MRDLLEMIREDIKAERKRATKQRQKAVSNPYVGPTCRVCRFIYPYVLHVHHVVPLGESTEINSEVVYLCPTCHAMVHEIRRLYYAPNRMRVRYHEDRLEQLNYWEDQQPDKSITAKLYDLAKRGIL